MQQLRFKTGILHFKLPGLVNDRLTSLCDICRQRGLDPADYPNPVVKLFAANLLYAFVGKDGEASGDFSLPDLKNPPVLRGPHAGL